ncbi:MAG: hypothetical protein ABH835_00850 [Patescibacteria group bacterium]|nr:hypothetical protein [Patescibacteria group bacterium]
MIETTDKDLNAGQYKPWYGIFEVLCFGELRTNQLFVRFRDQVRWDDEGGEDMPPLYKRMSSGGTMAKRADDPDAHPEMFHDNDMVIVMCWTHQTDPRVIALNRSDESLVGTYDSLTDCDLPDIDWPEPED